MKPEQYATPSEKARAGLVAVGALGGLLATSFGANAGGGQTPANATVAVAPSSFPAGEPCPLEGDDRGDQILNAQKNRYVAPASSEMTSRVATPGDMIDLPDPSGASSQSRDAWTDSAALAQINALESSGATIEGYLTDAIAENKGTGESCNCHEPDVLFDYHIYVADKPNATKAESVVVEMTPRWRSINGHWNYLNGGFKKVLSLKGHPVRVTGWLLFDEEHLNQVGEYRATVWEIHPVTAFEYKTDVNSPWTPL